MAVTSEYGTSRPWLRRLLARYVNTGCAFMPMSACDFGGCRRARRVDDAHRLLS